ncbi:MAG: hypothetical protein E7327_01580 [Clostridiales bacterium]|nr:hypothetical protein [Clostridiales bacterium]
MKHLWVLFAVFAVVLLPAAFTTVAMWVGISEDSLAWNHLLMGLMLLPVMLRCFFLPQILSVLNGAYLLYEGICSLRQRALSKGMIVGSITWLIMLISFPGLDMFFRAMMGI